MQGLLLAGAHSGPARAAMSHARMRREQEDHRAAARSGGAPAAEIKNFRGMNVSFVSSNSLILIVRLTSACASRRFTRWRRSLELGSGSRRSSASAHWMKHRKVGRHACICRCTVFAQEAEEGYARCTRGRCNAALATAMPALAA